MPQVNFGFREPFKVFLDGNFIHNAARSQQKSLQGQVEAVLGGKARLFTTRCVMVSIGAAVKGPTAEARKPSSRGDAPPSFCRERKGSSVGELPWSAFQTLWASRARRRR